MTTHTPPKTANTVMATRGTHEVVLLDTGSFPGYSNFLNQTWTFTSGDWTNTGTTLIDAAGPLPGRLDAVMSYDGTNVMLYGGRGASALDGVFQDTWTWNGSVWTKQTPATVPFGRYKAEAAYLAGTGVVMFGGETLGNMLNEVWVWSGSNWSQKSPATLPPARVDHAMAASASSVVLFGGRGTNSQFNDTWNYNGTTWTQATPATSPSIRSNAVMSYDTTNSLFVLYGGSDEYTFKPETWTYNGTTWTQRSIGTGPSGRIGAQMSFDPSSNKTILFGGIDATTMLPANDTWSFNGATFVWSAV